MNASPFGAASDRMVVSRSHQTAGSHNGLDKGFRSVAPRTRAALSPGASALCALTEKGVFDLPGTAVTVTIGEGGEFNINIQYPDKGEPK